MATQVPTLPDLVAEKMKPDEEFVTFANRWRSMASRVDIPIPESQAITMLVTNTTPVLRSILMLSEFPSFAHLYNRARVVQNQIKDSSLPHFFEGKPKGCKAPTAPTTEGVTVNECVNACSQPLRPPNKPSNPPSNPSNLHQFPSHPSKPYSVVPPPAGYTRPGPKRSHYPPLPETLEDGFILEQKPESAAAIIHVLNQWCMEMLSLGHPASCASLHVLVPSNLHCSCALVLHVGVCAARFQFAGWASYVCRLCCTIALSQFVSAACLGCAHNHVLHAPMPFMGSCCMPSFSGCVTGQVVTDLLVATVSRQQGRTRHGSYRGTLARCVMVAMEVGDAFLSRRLEATSVWCLERGGGGHSYKKAPTGWVYSLSEQACAERFIAGLRPNLRWDVTAHMYATLGVACDFFLFFVFGQLWPALEVQADDHSRGWAELVVEALVEMAPKKGNSEDIGWQHGTALGSRDNYKCNYCGHTGQGGGISRLKNYLAGGRLTGYYDVQGCKSVPAEVKRLMIEHLKGVRAETQRKRADREMHEKIISGRQRDEDDDDEPEIHAEYVPDVPEQRGSFEVSSGSGGSRSRVGGEMQSRTSDGKEVEGVVCSANLWDRVFKLVQIIEPLYEMKSFREGVGSFAEPTAIAGRDRIDGKRRRENMEMWEEGDNHILLNFGPKKKMRWIFLATYEWNVPCLLQVVSRPDAEYRSAKAVARKEETPSEDSPRLPSSRSHDSMTTGSPGRSVGGGHGDGGGDGGNDGDGGGGEGESGQGGGSGGGMIYAPVEDVQMASLRIVHPGCEATSVWCLERGGGGHSYEKAPTGWLYSLRVRDPCSVHCDWPEGRDGVATHVPTATGFDCPGGHRRRDIIATAQGVATVSRPALASRQPWALQQQKIQSYTSRSPSARHLRGCPVSGCYCLPGTSVPVRPLRECSRQRACSSHRLWSGGETVVKIAASSRLQSSRNWSGMRRSFGVLPGACQLVLLTASLFVAPEPPREARLGTVLESVGGDRENRVLGLGQGSGSRGRYIKPHQNQI
ncbi:hypothetical protein Taro_023251 [Colocasia esculenta]|uniref:Uncharacterized protein n=1 Tax=Colocasia esculenta TaxID=4460 RepID=A0A843V3R0_COLES|nr:hypothetical protein [Colocasia esculenta]